MASPTVQRLKDESKYQFAQLAFQYYVAGRTAYFQKLMPVCGNLLHHAVEMSLKAALTDTLTMPELKELRHKLRRIWAVFTQLHPDANTPEFKQTVAQLDSFEKLRYPNFILKNGAMLQWYLFREHIIPNQSGKPCVKPTVPEFPLVLEDIDGLLALVLEKASINPRAYTSLMSEQAREHLFLHNRHAERFRSR
jgi:hypothetical protein